MQLQDRLSPLQCECGKRRWWYVIFIIFYIIFFRTILSFYRTLDELSSFIGHFWDFMFYKEEMFII